MAAETNFQRWFADIPETAQQAWIKRRMLIVHRKLALTGLFPDARAEAQDIVMGTLERLWLEPVGEYAPHEGDITPQHYWWRCERVCVKAMIRRRVRDVRRSERIVGDEEQGVLDQLRSVLTE